MADASLLCSEGIVNVKQRAKQARAHKQENICVVSGLF